MLNLHLRRLASPESSGGSTAGQAAPGAGGSDQAPMTLDAEALARLAALDPTGESQLLERVLNAFQSSIARLMPQLDVARRSADRAAIRLVAHTLKSSSASIGALALSRLCAQVETAIRLDATGDLDADIDAMTEAIDAALRAIEQLLAERR
jgi:HPt (histidine-containing phosphotransfer) domain-containing protein